MEAHDSGDLCGQKRQNWVQNLSGLLSAHPQILQNLTAAWTFARFGKSPYCQSIWGSWQLIFILNQATIILLIISRVFINYYHPFLIHIDRSSGETEEDTNLGFQNMGLQLQSNKTIQYPYPVAMERITCPQLAKCWESPGPLSPHRESRSQECRPVATVHVRSLLRGQPATPQNSMVASSRVSSFLDEEGPFLPHFHLPNSLFTPGGRAWTR